MFATRVLQSLSARMPALVSALASGLALASSVALAAPDATDNSGINRRDRDAQTLTPLDQAQGKADIALVASARREVLGLKDLSVAGQNIKIISGGGRMTLRGPVASEAERDAIARAVRAIAGQTTVDNQLEIDGDPTPPLTSP